MIVRDADPARDAQACAEIYAPNVVGSVASFEEEAPDAEEMARRIGAYSASHAWLVCERDGVVVGYAYGCPHRARTAYRTTCEVSVYVAEEHRGLGIGRMLYVDLLDRMRVIGMRMALAGITLPNPPSERLHETFGFEPVGTFRNAGYKEDRWCDVGWWELDLQA